MDSQLVICLILFVLTCIGYITNIWSLGTTALVSLVALSLTGCLTPAEALGYFSNNTVIMIAAMSVAFVGVISFVGLIAPHIARVILRRHPPRCCQSAS